ncbi:MAG: ABC transporter permease [Nocardioidaceae bacterium]|nr:ABC transporter permease [Nocardioidaceae bacterium]NUS51540.1 ABC transporter permease [Nocardioidaceae bacterium]
MVARQRVYWTTVYQRTWKGSVITSFVVPLLYVVAMGVLLGGFVDRGGADLEGAPSYLAFVAPGLAAAHAMQIAAGETTWPVMGCLKWHRTYYAMVATPLAVPDVVTAHLAFAGCRIALTTGVFLLVMAPFGVFATVWGVLLAWPVLVLTGLAFCGLFFAYSATIRSESGFALIYRLLVIPLFLFSGAFFPISNLSPTLEAIARLTPLWHGVDLTRMLLLDTVRPGLALVHLTYLVVLAVGGWVLAVWRLDKRLEV